MNKQVRNILVGVAVATGGVAVVLKKLSASPEIKEKIKENGKKLGNDAKELSKSVSEAARETYHNISKEASVVVDKVKEETQSIIDEAKEKIEYDQKKAVDEMIEHCNDIVDVPDENDVD